MVPLPPDLGFLSSLPLQRQEGYWKARGKTATLESSKEVFGD